MSKIDYPTSLDDIDQWLYDSFGILPGCCSSIENLRHTTARMVAEALWPKKEKAGKVIYYSLLEQHTNGAWWYHKTTFTSMEEAEEYIKDWLWWDKKRPKMIFAHTSWLPKETMVTYDFKRFRNPYFEDELIAIL